MTTSGLRPGLPKARKYLVLICVTGALFYVIIDSGRTSQYYDTIKSPLQSIDGRIRTAFGRSEGPTGAICPPQPPHLVGQLNITRTISLEEAEERLRGRVLPGGSFTPSECHPRWRVAIIVPFRNREEHLGPFLHHLHPFLQRQQLAYTIYLINQKDSKLFNRAKLLNIGFVEAEKEGPYDCYAFHDVDLLPENDRHLYHCSAMPRHLNVAPSNTDYKATYKYYYGGVCLMTGDHLRSTNGWSNRYWGWGAEDDDMLRRIRLGDMVVWRYPKQLARFTMLDHKPSVVNKRRYEELERNINYYLTDGLNSLEYKLLSIKKLPLYTSIDVDVTHS